MSGLSYVIRGEVATPVEATHVPRTCSREVEVETPPVRVRYRSERFRFDVFAETKNEAELAVLRYLIEHLGDARDLPGALTIERYAGTWRGVYPVFFDDGQKTIWGQKAMSIRRYD